VVAYGASREGGDAVPVDAPGVESRCGRHWRWADLMRRAFEADVLACPRCGGRMALIATIDDPAVVRKILTHLGLPSDAPEARLTRPPPESNATLF